MNNKKLWTEDAEPKKLPRPTYMPFFMAIGLSFIFWGLISNVTISIAGVILTVLSLSGWIIILKNENRED